MRARHMGPRGRILLLGAAMTLLGTALRGFPPTVLALCDGLSLAALVYLMVAGWRFIMRQGSFASLKYGMLKLREIIRTKDYRRSQARLPGLGDYMASYHYEKPSLPYLIAAAVAGLCALLVWRLFGS